VISEYTSGSDGSTEQNVFPAGAIEADTDVFSQPTSSGLIL